MKKGLIRCNSFFFYYIIRIELGKTDWWRNRMENYSADINMHIIKRKVYKLVDRNLSNNTNLFLAANSIYSYLKFRKKKHIKN